MKYDTNVVPAIASLPRPVEQREPGNPEVDRIEIPGSLLRTPRNDSLTQNPSNTP